ncbi:uncharacterized protein MELLADRAFT_69489 [Melampsora larici-populina 98AG31]|uniref:Uncharacterized protein n=1 Tax=Melampsora larici-populina (strain 98AG31 / pathotype 3-4-7) TaxID=747676 RepID=F4SAX6_MELLP|nr:uncharacterized protein MELLADRAFT_69489 [Melampsora larici-populina 98AG31]EGF98183.1 hypothetical protein MELLADRAFT_69489 [Melampsora larici-populina 98AG31]
MSEVQALKSVILPKRLHHFLSSRRDQDSKVEPSRREYLQVIDVFHPQLCLPMDLRKEDVVRVYNIIVSPFFGRKEVFNVDTNAFYYNPALQLLPEGESGYLVISLVLPNDLIKFMALHDPAEVVEATQYEYHHIINLFYPELGLPLCLNKIQVMSLFNIAVLPFFQQLDNFNEETGKLSYIPVQINPKFKVKKPRVKAVYLPAHLQGFLAYKDPAVTVGTGVYSVEKLSQIIDLFHPSLRSPGPQCKGGWYGLFEVMVLPYLRNIVSFDISTGIMRFVAVALPI